MKRLLALIAFALAMLYFGLKAADNIVATTKERTHAQSELL